jgi:RNA polymerase sigma-70 factor, ECF subfamily
MRNDLPRTPRRTSSHTPVPCRPGGCAGLCTDDGLARAVAEHRGRMLVRARLVVVDPHLAEDAVQEAFLRAWRSCASFDPDGGPLAHWLLALTRNVAIDLVRARRRRPDVVPLPGTHDVGSPGPDPAELVDLRAELRQLLQGIAAEQRHAIVETLLRDRAPACVAADLGIPPGTLRSRLHYGLRQMRVQLQTADAA